MHSPANMICLHHVLREEGIEMSTSDAVSCGLRIAAVWRERTGSYPAMHLHLKEGVGPGYNNYAHYEADFRPVMLELVREYQSFQRRQAELF